LAFSNLLTQPQKTGEEEASMLFVLQFALRSSSVSMSSTTFFNQILEDDGSIARHTLLSDARHNEAVLIARSLTIKGLPGLVSALSRGRNNQS
jgi:hypothetical protein